MIAVFLAAAVFVLPFVVMPVVRQYLRCHHRWVIIFVIRNVTHEECSYCLRRRTGNFYSLRISEQQLLVASGSVFQMKNGTSGVDYKWLADGANYE